MLRHEGHDRTDSQNRRVAGALAMIAGFVNAAGFLLIGTFTSHVTGNVGRMTGDLANQHAHAALLAAMMVGGFFLGAFLASLAIEATTASGRHYVYGLLLIAEATLLLVFFVIARLVPSASPRVHDAEAVLLCTAMGLQNSLVTRLSGAVVRTTHLTGVVTDFGIEAARWVRYVRHHIPGAPTPTSSMILRDRPNIPKMALLATIFGTFVVGGAVGAATTLWWHDLALLIPITGLVGFGLFGLRAAREIDDTVRL